MPKPKAMDAEFAANAAADSAEFGDIVPPRPGEKPRRSGGAGGSSRDGSRGAGGGRSAGGSRSSASASRPPRERRPDVAAAAVESAPIDVPVHATEGVAVSASATAPTAVGEAGDAARKPRRRRGGRNRRREGVAETVGAAGPSSDAQTSAVAKEGSRAPRGERRPPRERSGAEASSNGGRPSRQVAVTSGNAASKPAGDAVSAKKPGLFSRLTRLFTGR